MNRWGVAAIKLGYFPSQELTRRFSHILRWYLRHDLEQVHRWFPPYTKH